MGIRSQYSAKRNRLAIHNRQGSHKTQTTLPENQLSQEKLAALAGLHRTFVSMVERGKRNVTIATVEKLAAGLKCRMADLMPDAEGGKRK